MNVKYQIFVSSTYEDLKDERNEIIKACLNMGHIPVGMEMFNAADEEQWAKLTAFSRRPADSPRTAFGCVRKSVPHWLLVWTREKLNAPVQIAAELVLLGLFFNADQGCRGLNRLRHHSA
jgi:hypothetical protein